MNDIARNSDYTEDGDVDELPVADPDAVVDDYMLYHNVLSFRQSLVVFRKPFFWCLFFGNLAGLAGGILVITQALQMWQGNGASLCACPPGPGRSAVEPRGQ